MQLSNLTYKVAPSCRNEFQSFPYHITGADTPPKMASQDSSSEKMQPSPVTDAVGPLGRAECQTDRAVHQGVAGSLGV
jgi:hypothetical protein